MPDTLRRRDVDFLLFDVLGIDGFWQEPRFSHLDRQSAEAILDNAFRIAREQFQPIAARADAEEARFADGKAVLPAALKPALQAYIDAGFLSAAFPLEAGGLGLPYSLSLAAHAAFTAANNPVAGYAFLTSAAANLLVAHGSDAQKARYLPPMLDGRFFGTMVLSEPQAGSSLADLKTSALPLGDRLYAITGSKTWISGGDHDLSQNIVHLVLARIEGAPAGTRGLSLFIVPKRRVLEDGTSGASNGVTLIGLNHKLGHRGTTNCVLAFGDAEPCHGELVGQAGRGLSYMFHMMNEARTGVGTGAAVTAYAGYLHALDYAQTRLQGRRHGERDPATPQVPLIAHADVRRMLMAQKVVAEGGLALCLYCGWLVDRQKSADPVEARDAGLLLDLLTPIAKSWPSEEGVKANSLAIQVLGGAGYTRDHPVERLFRDQRLNPIHEGTTGIQAMDLLGRKVANGDAVALLAREIERTIAASQGVEGKALAAALTRWRETTNLLLAATAQDPELGLANATLYLEVSGLLVVAWMWLKVANIADKGEQDAFLQGKQAARRYFFRYELPRLHVLADLLDTLDRTCLDMETEAF